MALVTVIAVKAYTTLKIMTKLCHFITRLSSYGMQYYFFMKKTEQDTDKLREKKLFK